MAVTFEGGRFANTGRTWQANEETPVTGWDKDTVGIFGLGIGSTSHNGDTVTPELRWRNVTDAGSWTVLGATGEVKQATTTALTDDGNLATGNFGTSSSKTAVTGNGCEQENSGVASSSTSLAQNEFTELQVGISFADGDPGDEYEFAVYDGGSAEGTSLATVTLAAGAVQETIAVVATGTPALGVKVTYKNTIAVVAAGIPGLSVGLWFAETIAVVATAIPSITETAVYKHTIAVVATAIPVLTTKATYKNTIAVVATGIANVTASILGVGGKIFSKIIGGGLIGN